MMLAAANDTYGETPVSVENTEFRKLLFLNRPRTSVMQLHYEPRDGSAAIHSGPSDNESSWTVHTTTRMGTRPPEEAGGHLDLQALRERCADAMPASEHYEMLERRAYVFGQAFRTLQEIWLGSDEAAAPARCPDTTSGVAPRHRRLIRALIRKCGSAEALIR
jgi:hypothetical protein